MSQASRAWEESSRVGISGVADKRAVINVADLARQKASRRRATKKRRSPPFIPTPQNMPVPDEPNEPAPSTADVPSEDLDSEDPAITEAPPTNTAVSRDERSGPTAQQRLALGPGGLAASPIAMASFPAIEDNGFFPPDAGGAVGPNHLMAVHNGTVRIQDKAGGTLTTMSLNTFWATVAGPGGTFDPKVLYDIGAGRWIITACDDSRSATSGVLVGVSQSADPTGNWNLYKVTIAAADSAWADYPSVGFNSKWIVVQVNMVVGTVFNRSHVYVFNKADLLAQGTGLYTLLSLTGMGGSQVPSIGESTSQPGTLFLLQEWNGNSGSKGYLRLYTITGAVGSETLTPLAVTLINTTSTWDSSAPAGANLAPQFNSTQRIQLNDGRIHNNVLLLPGISNDYLYAAHTVFLPAGGPATHSAIQFWCVRTNGNIEQLARIDDPTGATCFAFPSIAITALHSVLIGFSSFSGSQYPGANWAFRWGNDPPNTLQIGGVLKSGEGPYHKLDNNGLNRWGDYSSTSFDPDQTSGPMIWTLQEYARPPLGMGDGSGRWGTWWGRFLFLEIG